jgi:hypothetical protein
MTETVNAIGVILDQFPDLGSADFAALHDALLECDDERRAHDVYHAEWTVFRRDMQTKGGLVYCCRVLLSHIEADHDARDLGAFVREVKRYLAAGIYARAVPAAQEIAANYCDGTDGVDTVFEIVRHLADDALWVGREPGFPSDGLELILREAGAVEADYDPTSLAVCCHWSIQLLDARAVVRWNVDEWKVCDLEVSTPDGTVRHFHDDVLSFLQTYGL